MILKNSSIYTNKSAKLKKIRIFNLDAKLFIKEHVLFRETYIGEKILIYAKNLNRQNI